MFKLLFITRRQAPRNSLHRQRRHEPEPMPRMRWY
jgi:hypothetical protein